MKPTITGPHMLKQRFIVPREDGAGFDVIEGAPVFRNLSAEDAVAVAQQMADRDPDQKAN